MENDQIRKNILDLNFQKYLVIASTSVVIGFTYILTVTIAFFTDQLNFNNFFYFLFVLFISFIVLAICIYYFSIALYHLGRIPKILKTL